MLKVAILVEASHVQGYNDLPGARKDMDTWRDYLGSSHGGGWKCVFPYSQPRLADLSQKINMWGRIADFVFVAFSGHGFHDKASNTTCVVLNDSEKNVPVEKFIPSGPRSIVVIDACRGVERSDGRSSWAVVNESAHLKSAALSAMQNRAFALDESENMKVSDEKRIGWYNALAQAQQGCSLLYSCSIGEAADEDRNAGGVYTSAITRCANLWCKEVAPPASLSVRAAHELATQSVRSSTGTLQNPQASYTGTAADLPFAVRL